MIDAKIKFWEHELIDLKSAKRQGISVTNKELMFVRKALSDLREIKRQFDFMKEAASISANAHDKIKAREGEMKEIVRETIEWLKSVEGNDQMEANPDATILELEKLL